MYIQPLRFQPGSQESGAFAFITSNLITPPLLSIDDTQYVTLAASQLAIPLF